MNPLLYAAHVAMTIILIVWLGFSMVTESPYEFLSFTLVILIAVEITGITLLGKRN